MRDAVNRRPGAAAPGRAEMRRPGFAHKVHAPHAVLSVPPKTAHPECERSERIEGSVSAVPHRPDRPLDTLAALALGVGGRGDEAVELLGRGSTCKVRHPIAVVAALLLACAAPAGAGTITRTTTYAYNADGAPTATTVQVGDQPAVTTYLTWENFTPDPSDPSSGTVSAADGNLLGVGPAPGAGALEQRFTYDERDRLIGCLVAAGEAATYAYHPTGTLASSTLPDDELLFYQDGAAMPLMCNTTQTSTGATASFLGGVRYLNDGTEQVLLNPRKDVNGVYDADAGTMTAYEYDPYGSTEHGVGGSGLGVGPLTPNPLDLSRNPFQYAGQYLDPICRAYYLRARWYLANQQTFLTRDPADFLHRYSYTQGNPITRTDPSGLRSAAAAFSHEVGRAVHTLEPGGWAYAEPLLPVWGQVMSGIQMVGLTASFWHHPSAEKGASFAFLALGVAGEGAMEFEWLDRALSTPARALGARIALDATLGLGQTAMQSVHHGRIDPLAVLQGVESTASTIFWGRYMGGIGYRPFGLEATDVDGLASDHFKKFENINKALVFRLRYDNWASFSSPFTEQFHLGNYHEAVFAVSRETLWKADVGQLADDSYTWDTAWTRDAKNLRKPSSWIAGKATRRLALVGSHSTAAVESAVKAEMDFNEQYDANTKMTGQTVSAFPEYRKYTNNCQDNAARIRANIVKFEQFGARKVVQRISDLGP